MPTDVVTIDLDEQSIAELDALGTALSRNRSSLIAEAVMDYLADQRRQIAGIEEGLRQADRGEFATDEEVAAAFARWQ